ncbi:MAG TPA: NifB/NifX family molybdenum-iron cluster-binding protein [Geobacteraceae bacterium]|nr:NifB/NifX family molybdenum-iron cluster-binding protein [Geobacteraceae bacterium]
MRLCFPVGKDAGLESRLYGHFASAPFFMEIDTDTNKVSGLVNSDQFAPEAGCDPFKALASRRIDAVIVDGIGDGYLQALNSLGIRVFQAQSASVRENIELLIQNSLFEVEMLNSAEAGRCSDGEGEHGCDHSHDD